MILFLCKKFTALAMSSATCTLKFNSSDGLTFSSAPRDPNGRYSCECKGDGGQRKGRKGGMIQRRLTITMPIRAGFALAPYIVTMYGILSLKHNWHSRSMSRRTSASSVSDSL